jgi:hypothetical protein
MQSLLNALMSSIPWARILEWLTEGLSSLSMLALLGGFWTLVAFRRNNRIKAAEILLKLEEECRACLPTLNALEDAATYTKTYEAALESAIDHSPKRKRQWTARNLGATSTANRPNPVEEVDRVLRHLHACYHVRRLGVDAGALDRAYTFYLRMCISEDRRALRNYVRHFWRNVFFWAERAGKPWPKRTAIYVRQVGPRLVHWWGHAPKRKGQGWFQRRLTGIVSRMRSLRLWPG